MDRYIRTSPTGRVELRLATAEDLPSIWTLIADYGQLYSHELAPVSPEVAYELVAGGQLMAITLDGYPVGGFAFTDLYEKLHCEIHLLVQPWAMRHVLRSTVLIEAISALFYLFNVIKLKAKCLERQTQAKRLLRSYGFRKKVLLSDETRFKGELADLELYELTQSYWIEKWLPSHDIWKRETSKSEV